MGNQEESSQQTTIESRSIAERRIDVLATLQLLLESTGQAAFVVPLPKKLIAEVVDVLNYRAEVAA